MPAKTKASEAKVVKKTSPAKKPATAKAVPAKTTSKPAAKPAAKPVAKKQAAKPAAKPTTKPAQKKSLITKEALKADVKKVKAEVKKVASSVKNEFKDDVKKLEGTKYYKELILMLTRPDKFFGVKRSSSDLNGALLQVLGLGFVAGFIQVLLNIFSQTNLIAHLLPLFTYPVLALIGTFAISGISMLIAYVCKGEMDFPRAVKNVSYTMVILPVAVVLMQIAAIFKMSILYYSFSLAIALVFSFWVYNLVVFGLKGNKKIAMLLLAIVVVLTILYMPRAGYDLTHLANQINIL